jgi:predicted  nucleic acid-binding Zn-ribbon protein
MNISLRKASAIQNSINEAIRSIKIVKQLKINEFQDVATELQKANDSLFTADTRRQRLLLALYNIRGLVGAANAQSGIDMKLATAAFIDKRIGQLDELAGVEVMTELSVISGQLDKIKNRPNDTRATIYGYSDTVETSVVTQPQLDQVKTEIKSLKKQKQKVNDEILELNIKTEIPLSEDVVKTLTEEGLI